VLGALRGGQSYKNNWLRELLALELEPEVEILEEGSWSQESTDDRERYWIANFRESPLARLTNVMAGGSVYNGPRLPSDTRGESMRTWLATSEGQQQRRQAMLDRYAANPEQRMSDTAAFREHWLVPENIDALAKHLRDLYDNEPERREIIAEQSRDRWADPEYKARKTLQSPQYRAQRREIAREIASRRRRCAECGFYGNPSGVGSHLKFSGHIGWITAEGGE
jgi:hypothetical protein